MSSLHGPGTGTLNIDALTTLALEMADRADRMALAAFGLRQEVERKDDGTPVTAVDRRIEAALREMLDQHMPEAGILGEEYGEQGGIGRWVIDPIDGTVQFIDADPRFSILLAYEMEGVGVVGVVSAPALGVRWWAGRGSGAHVSENGHVREATVSTTGGLAGARAMMVEGVSPQAVSGERLVGAGLRLSLPGLSWEAARVATGELDVAITSGAIWDVAPLPVIVDEAGGSAMVLGEADGRRSLLLTNRSLADEALNLFG